MGHLHLINLHPLFVQKLMSVLRTLMGVIRSVPTTSALTNAAVGLAIVFKITDTLAQVRF